MKLKKYLDTDDYAFLSKLISANVIEHQALIKTYFDTSKYYGDPELLRDMIAIVDAKLYIPWVKPSKIYLFLKAISPITLTESDTTREPHLGWERSYLRLFWQKMIHKLITDNNKNR